jgi:hypothetical protein
MWILAGQKPEPFLSYLQTYPDPELQALLNNPAELKRNINFLERMMPEGAPQVVDGIPHSDLNSSTIWGTKYDPKTAKMTVRFQGGSEYEYDGIPPNVYQAVAQGAASARTDGQNEYGRWWKNKNPSAGAALNQYVKEMGFPYQKIK